MRDITLTLLALCALTAPDLLHADPAQIEHVAARHTGGDTWHFDVTLRHGDTGWDDYADGWRVLDMDGAELGMRVLHHPHETEQPFTRSLGGVAIPREARQVQIQARTNTDGWGPQTVTVDLR